MNPLENTTLVFLLAIVLGLLYPQLSAGLEGYIILLLVVAMSLSLVSVTFSRNDMQSGAGASLRSFLLNYGFLSASILLLAYLLVPNPEYFAGFVIMAAVPPAVAVVPFTYLLRGDSKASLGGEVLCYLLSLVAAPIITLSILGFMVDAVEMLKTLLLVIVVPLVLSRILLRLPKRHLSFKTSVINVCFAAITYCVIGLNQPMIVGNAFSLAPLVFILLLTSFGTGSFIYVVSKRFGTGKERAVSYALFGSLKNGGMTAVFAMTLVSAAASLPAALHSFFTVFFFMFLKFISGRS